MFTLLFSFLKHVHNIANIHYAYTSRGYVVSSVGFTDDGFYEVDGNGIGDINLDGVRNLIVNANRVKVAV
jgi:hypothetical protein